MAIGDNSPGGSHGIGNGGLSGGNTGFSGGDPGRGGDNIEAILQQVLNPNQPLNPIIQAAQIQADALTEGQKFFQPFLEAGNQALPFLQQGATPQGLDEILSMIFSGDQFQNLVGERQRGLQGQLAAGGLTRSGTAIQESANIPTELGFAIEQLLSGRASGLADRGENAAFDIANLLSGSAEATASGILGLEESRAQRGANRSNNNTKLASAFIGLLSDPRLKDNIRVLGQVGPLDFVEWDWKPEYKEVTGKYPTRGFLSTQVREHFPEFVKEFGGFDMINYGGLVEELSWH